MANLDFSNGRRMRKRKETQKLAMGSQQRGKREKKGTTDLNLSNGRRVDAARIQFRKMRLKHR